MEEGRPGDPRRTGREEKSYRKALFSEALSGKFLAENGNQRDCSEEGSSFGELLEGVRFQFGGSGTLKSHL